MKLIHTAITDVAANRLFVTLQIADARPLEDAPESISIAVEVETPAHNPGLSEVRGAALSRALEIIRRETTALIDASRSSV